MYILPTSVGVFYYNRHWRSIPPGRIGYPIYPARSNKCAGLYRQRVPCKLRVVRRLLARWPTTGCGKVDRLGRSTTQPCDLGAKSGYYTRAPPPNPAGGRSGPLSGGCPISRLPTLVWIYYREIPNVARVWRRFTGRASDNHILGLNGRYSSSTSSNRAMGFATHIPIIRPAPMPDRVPLPVE